MTDKDKRFEILNKVVEDLESEELCIWDWNNSIRYDFDKEGNIIGCNNF